MSQQPKYGAISGGGDEENQGDFEKVEGSENRSDYDIGQTYYLHKTGGGWKKVCRALIPILVALFIVGGVGYYFFENILNPGGHGGGGEIETTNESVKSTTSKIPVPAPGPAPHEAKHSSSTSTAAAPDTKSSSTSSTSASCSAHPKCSDTGLTGKCCPAEGGIMLECCN